MKVSHKKNSILIPDIFVQKMNAQFGIIKTANQLIDKMEAEYLEHHCKLKPGQTIKLPPDAREGYDVFLIKKVMVDIQPHPKEKNRYYIGWLVSGTYKGEGKDPFEGNIRFKNDNAKKETL